MGKLIGKGDISKPMTLNAAKGGKSPDLLSTWKISICVQETPDSKVCARLLWYRTVNSKGCSSLRSGSIMKQVGLESKITVFYCIAGNVSSKINKVIKHIARELNFIFLARQRDPILLRKAVC